MSVLRFSATRARYAHYILRVVSAALLSSHIAFAQTGKSPEQNAYPGPNICVGNFNSGLSCTCPSGTTLLATVSGGQTCCVPDSCPTGQVGTCGQSGGSCACPAGQILAASASTQLPISGISSGQQCITIPNCPGGVGYNCDANGMCTCLTCPNDGNKYAVQTTATGLVCQNLCPAGSKRFKIKVKEGCGYRTDANGNYDFAHPQCTAAHQNQDGTEAFSGEVPQCLLQQLTQLCANFDGKQHSKVGYLPPLCMGPLTASYDALMILYNLNVAAENVYNSDKTQANLDAWVAAYNTYMAAFDVHKITFASCDPFFSVWPVASDDCAAFMQKKLFASNPPEQVLPYTLGSYNTEDFHLKRHFGITEFEFELNNQCGTPTDQDKNCTQQQVDYTFLYSPISLELGEKKVEAVVSASDFPLDPNQKNSWYWWRGSPETPLLVINNANGEVKSAAQLFGTFTEGKVRKDGYEALGSFDKDNDGVLRGQELKGLALWSDVGSDGLAAFGEVKPLSEFGITALFYKGAQRTDSANLRLNRGFERTVKGVTSIGSSVDWFSPSFKARDEAIMSAMRIAASANLSRKRISLNSLQTIPPAVANGELLPPQEAIEFEKFQNATATGPLSGFWTWTLTSTSGQTNDDARGGGLLALYETRGEVNGYSYVESKISDDPKSRRHVVVVPLKGRVLGSSADGGTQFEFFVTRKNGDVTRTVGTISKDGGHINAYSKMVMDKTADKSKPLGSVEYAWTAQKTNIRSKA